MSLSLIGCLKEAEVSSFSLISPSSITFSGDKESEILYISSSVDSVAVSGVCITLSSQIELSEDGGMTWHIPTSGDFDCRGDSAFSFSFPSALQSGNWSPYFSSYVPAEYKEFFLRVQNPTGTSKSIKLTIKGSTALSLSINDIAIDEDFNGVVVADALVQASREGLGFYGISMATSPECADNGAVMVDSTSGAVSFYPNLNYYGTCNIKITFDDNMTTVVDEFTLTVNPINDAPTLTHTCPMSLNQGQALACVVTGSDPDGPSIIYSLAAGNTCTWASLNASGVFSGTPSNSDVGLCELKFKANDTFVDSAIKTVVFTVNNVVPTLTISPQIIAEDSILNMANAQIQASEENFGTYSIIPATNAPDCDNHGSYSTINANTGAFSFTPDINYYGLCFIKIKFDDGHVGGVVTSEMALTVMALNDAPTIAVISNQSTLVNTALNNVAMSLADLDGPLFCNNTSLTATSSNTSLITPANISFSGAWPNCTISMNPAAAMTGTSTITVIVNDGFMTANTNFNFTVTPPLSLEVENYYSVATNWNQYVVNNNSNPYALSNTACSGTEATAFGCLHGAEILKVEVSDFADCTNLTMTDSPLSAFDWECFDMGASVEFRTRELKHAYGLRHLLTASGWRTDMSVSLFNSAIFVRNSLPTNWWSNSIEPLPDASVGTQTLNVANSIYVSSGTGDSTVKGYNIAADGIALVTLNTDRLMHPVVSPSSNCNYATGTTGSPNTHVMICAGSRKYIWIEAHIESAGTLSQRAGEGIFLHNTSFSQIRHSKIRNLLNGINYGLTLNSSSKNKIFGTEIYNSGNGYYLNNGSNNNLFFNSHAAKATNSSIASLLKLNNTCNDNMFYFMRLNDVASTDADTSGVVVYGSNNLFSNLIISNIGSTTFGNGSGIRFSSVASNDNRFTQVTINNVGGSGVVVTNNSFRNIFTHFTIANTGYQGVFFASTTADSDNLFHSFNILSGDKGIETNTTGVNATSGVRFSNTAISSVVASPVILITSGDGFNFEGYLQVNDSTVACGASGSNLNTSCVGGGISTLSKTGATGQFVGKGATDALNPLGSGTLKIFSIFTDATHFLNFDSFFKSWGKDDGTAFPNPDFRFRGRCGATLNCSIYDWSLKTSGATAFLNRSGNANTANAGFVTGGGTCASPLSGTTDTLTPTTGNSGMAFMKNAIELIDDTGDNDGLCESNEKCVYAPNIGSYQGHGVLSASSNSMNYCLAAGSNVTNAKIYAYPANGY
jgi:hypothetical protein